MALNFHKRNKGFVAIISAGIAAIFMLSIVMTAVGGKSYSSSQTIEDYVKAAEEKLAKNPKDYQLLVDIANNYMNLAGSEKSDLNKTKSSNSTYDKAVSYYKRALAINSKDNSVRTDMAISLYYSGKADEAIQTVEKVIKEEPNFAPAHFNYGIFLTSKNDFKKAVEELKTAKDLDPTQFSQSVDSMLPQFEQMSKAPAGNTGSNGTTSPNGGTTPSGSTAPNGTITPNGVVPNTNTNSTTNNTTETKK